MSSFVNQWSSQLSCRHQVIYQAWHQECIQQTLHIKKKWMKDDISYKI